MKKINILFLTMSLAAISIVANAQDKKQIKNAIQKADSIKNITFMDQGTPFEQHSFLIPDENILIKDFNTNNPFFKNKIVMIPPGKRSFTVEYSKFHGNGSSKSGSIPVSAEFEAGKFYTFDYEIFKGEGFFSSDAIKINVVEATDKNIIENAEKDIANIKKYMIWASTHPEVLTGTYTSKNGKAQISFSGNKAKFHDVFLGAIFEYDATFWFNEETIILKIESLLCKRKKSQTKYPDESPIPGGKIRIWYYKLNNDTLEIIPQNKEYPSFKELYFKN